MPTKNQTRRSRQARNGSAQSRQLSFLPEPEFNPKWPNSNTKAYQALDLMLHGEPVRDCATVFTLYGEM